MLHITTDINACAWDAPFMTFNWVANAEKLRILTKSGFLQIFDLFLKLWTSVYEYPRAFMGSIGSYKCPEAREPQTASEYSDEHFNTFHFFEIQGFEKVEWEIFEIDHFHCMVSKGYSTQGFSAKTKSQQFKMAEQQQY